MNKKLKSIIGILMSVCMLTAVGAGCKNQEETVEKSTLIDYEAYKGKNKLVTSVWDFPRMIYDENAEAGKRFDCEENDRNAEDMVNAGVDVVNITGLGTNVGYDGLPITDFSKASTVTALKELINFFNKHGIKTVINSHNHGNSLDEAHMINDFTNEEEFPEGITDFSACDGFYGFICWDEPSKGQYEKLAEFAENFDEKYGDTDAMFMVNLLPAYGQAGWGTRTFDEYLDGYAETVLSKIKNTKKYISLDTYPVKANGSFGQTFLTDIAKLKAASLKYGAMSHVCLQSTATAWDTATSEWRNRTPNREEYGIQIYSALALGIDSISWYTYVDPQEDEPLGLHPAPVNFYTGERNEQIYNDFKSINDEIDTFDYALKCFTWKGFLTNEDVSLLGVLASQNYTKKYYISDAAATKTLTSVFTAGLPYVMGRMVDGNGNEGFMIANYTVPSEAKEGDVYKMTLNFKKGVNKLIVWQNGQKNVVDVNGSYELELKLGGGAFVVPYAE